VKLKFTFKESEAQNKQGLGDTVYVPNKDDTDVALNSSSISS